MTRQLKQWRRKRQPKGQIATFLILLMAAVLMFTMMTANLGQASLTATVAANATDAASLHLSSQLATRSKLLSDSLVKSCGNGMQCCTRGGFLGVFLAIVFAAIAVFVPPVSAALVGVHGSAIAAGAIGGAIGGAAGGAVVQGNFSGALMGALQGAAIGASIGYGAQAFGSQTVGTGGTIPAAGGVAGPNGATMLGNQAWLAPGTALQAGATVVSGSAIIPMANMVGAALGATLASSAALYNQSVREKLSGDAIAQFAKALSGLPEYQAIQQGVILEGFSRMVDDPNMTNGTCYQTDPFDLTAARGEIRPVPVTGDPFDSDGDGNTTKITPCFQYWWDRRTQALRDKVLRANIPPKIDAFLGALHTFVTQAQATHAPSSPGAQSLLSRSDIEGVGIGGSLEELAKALENAGHPVSFWAPGPPASQIESWEETGCQECAPPAGWSEEDVAVRELQSIESTAEGLSAPKSQAETTWETWAPWFYDPNSTDDDYDTLHTLVEGNASDVKGLRGWQRELEDIKTSLPACTCDLSSQQWQWQGRWSSQEAQQWVAQGKSCEAAIDLSRNGQWWGGGFPIVATNAPCRISEKGFATSDQDLIRDEFQQVRSQIETLISQIETFRNAMRDDLNGLSITLDGPNPGVYRWRDSRGDHTVRVSVGPFKLPRLVRTKSGGFFRKKICVRLAHYSDSGRKAWVEISRTDPPNPNHVSFWPWNTGTIRKMSRGSYNVNQVGMSGIGR